MAVRLQLISQCGISMSRLICFDIHKKKQQRQIKIQINFRSFQAELMCYHVHQLLMQDYQPYAVGTRTGKTP